MGRLGLSMKMLVRRGQRMDFKKAVFILQVRVEVSDEDKACIEKYKLGSELIYQKNELPVVDAGTLRGFAQFAVARAMNVSVSVNDLINGKHIECKNIIEMLDAEMQIRDAARNFYSVLRAAAKFGGEEVIDLAA